MDVVNSLGTRAFQTADEVLSYWWLWLVRGALAILFGIAAWTWPDLTLATLIYLFGAYLIVDGITNVISMVRMHDVTWGRRFLLLLWGVVQIVAGFVILVAPGIGVLTLMVMFGIWVMSTGILFLVTAFSSDGSFMSPWLQALLGVLGLIVGVYLIVEPGRGALASIWVFGVVAIVYGVALIAAAFSMRSMRSRLHQAVAA